MELRQAAEIVYGFDPEGLQEEPEAVSVVNDYDSAMVEQARQIVAGETMLLPTVDHLRVLLEWLDIKWESEKGSGAALEGDAPF